MYIENYTNKEGSDNEVKIVGLTKEEKDNLLAMVAGAKWVRRDGKNLVASEVYKGVPSPVEDPQAGGFWPPLDKSKASYTQLKLLDAKEYQSSDPPIIIQHLCGYCYTPERYVTEAKKLESYGFECLRSRRGDNGKYWEIWYLPSFYCAKGSLNSEIERLRNASPGENRKIIEGVVSFLCRRVTFGTMDLSFQRAAMIAD